MKLDRILENLIMIEITDWQEQENLRPRVIFWAMKEEKNNRIY